MMTKVKIKPLVTAIMIMALAQTACTSPSPVLSTQTPRSQIATETANPTQTVKVLPSVTAAIPTHTETSLVETISTFTPGPPTSTPILIAFTPAPAECVRTQSATHSPVYLSDCVYWVDEHANESGFRVELSYLNSGEYFLYDVPANTVAFALPSEALPRLEESREQCLRRKDFQVLVYALFAQDPPVIVSGMAFNGECGQGVLLTATATSALQSTWLKYENPELGFRLQYPETWFLKSIPLDAAGGGVQISTHDPAEIGKVSPENFFKLEVGVAGGRLRVVNQSMIDWWHSQADYDPAKIRQETDVQVAGISALEVTTEASLGLVQKTIYLPYRHPDYGETVLFIASSPFSLQGDMEIFQQVVSSFTFDPAFIGK